MNWLGLILLGAGLFAVAGAALDWDWFMNHPKARLFVNLFGRAGARVFYILLGLFLAAMGSGVMLGLIELQNR